MTTARSVRLPAPSTAQEAVYGALVSVPSETHEPAAQSVLTLSQRKSSTWSTSLGLVAVTVNGSEALALTYPLGEVSVTAGGAFSTLTEIGAETVELPAPSYAVTRTS